jgi:hypothetical protein
MSVQTEALVRHVLAHWSFGSDHPGAVAVPES